MNNLELQDAIKSDILNIPKLRFRILSAKELYGSYLSFILISSLVLLSLNILIHIICHTKYAQHPSVNIIIKDWIFTFFNSAFICMFLNTFILFFKLIKYQINTADFLKKKCSNFCSLFVIIYGIIYILSVVLISNASFNFDDFPDLMFMQMFAGMISLILSFIILVMEINRLGIGALFEVIGVCISRISENNKEM